MHRRKGLLFVLAVAIIVAAAGAVLLFIPPHRYANTALERRVENLAIACGQYDAARGNTEYKGVFLTDPGMAGAYLYINEYCASIGSQESLQLVLSIGAESPVSQSQIYRVFARAYDDSYDRTLTPVGRVQMKMKEAYSKLGGH